jgi:hypothetical protein
MIVARSNSRLGQHDTKHDGNADDKQRTEPEEESCVVRHCPWLDRIEPFKKLRPWCH